jgi:hypothetical protein
MNTLESPGSRDSYSQLGVCWVIYGILRLVIAMWLVTFMPVGTVMFGALLVRVADYIPAMEVFHAFYIFAIILSVLCGVCVRGLRWSRVITAANEPSRDHCVFLVALRAAYRHHSRRLYSADDLQSAQS